MTGRQSSDSSLKQNGTKFGQKKLRLVDDAFVEIGGPIITAARKESQK
jgi:hypothetical protein